jgi:mono/diheme cytochrome c family protein
MRWSASAWLGCAAVVCATAVGAAQDVSQSTAAQSQAQSGTASTTSAPTPAGTASGTGQGSMPKGNVEHGQYLVERVVMCVECHSDRDEAGNINPRMRFKGGPIPFRPPWPNDWAVRAPRNAGLPGYTDELALRLLTQGAIDRTGRQLRPPMPRFRMTPQDAADVIAYMRTLK